MATRDDGHDGYDGLRAAVLATVRESYRLLRPKLDAAGITRADEEASGGPSDAFAQLAQTLREVALHKALRGAPASADAMHSDAMALEMLAAIARGASVTWAEVRS